MIFKTDLKAKRWVASCGILLFATVGAGGSQAVAQISSSLADEATESGVLDQARTDAVLQLHQIAQRVAREKWERALANPERCTKPSSSFGFSVHDLGVYPPALKGSAQRVFGISSGALAIWTVAPGSPADLAGLRPGDVISSIGNNSNLKIAEASRLIDALPAEQNTVLSINRAGIQMTFMLAPQRVCSDNFATSAASDVALLSQSARVIGSPGIQISDEEIAKKLLFRSAEQSKAPPQVSKPLPANAKDIKSGKRAVYKAGSKPSSKSSLRVSRKGAEPKKKAAAPSVSAKP